MPLLHLESTAPHLRAQVEARLPAGWRLTTGRGVSDGSRDAVLASLPVGLTAAEVPSVVVASPESASRFLPGRNPWPDAGLIILPRDEADYDALLRLRRHGADHYFLRLPESDDEWAAHLGRFTRVLVPADSDLAPRHYAALARAFLQDEIVDTTRVVMDVFVDALQTRDPYTSGHSDRVALGCVIMGMALGLPAKALERLGIAGTLHDVGKLGISDAVLRKAGKLDAGEMAEMRTHPTVGAELVNRYPALRAAVPAILQHHEFFDGTGYPYRKAGPDTTRDAKVIAIVDAYDSITSDRPYRQGRPAAVATAEIERCAGTQFDPTLATLFIALQAQGAFPSEADIAAGILPAPPAALPRRS